MSLLACGSLGELQLRDVTSPSPHCSILRLPEHHAANHPRFSKTGRRGLASGHTMPLFSSPFKPEPQVQGISGLHGGMSCQKARGVVGEGLLEVLQNSAAWTRGSRTWLRGPDATDSIPDLSKAAIPHTATAQLS